MGTSENWGVTTAGTSRDKLVRIRVLAVLAGVWLRLVETEISAEVRKAVAQ